MALGAVDHPVVALGVADHRAAGIPMLAVEAVATADLIGITESDTEADRVAEAVAAPGADRAAVPGAGRVAEAVVESAHYAAWQRESMPEKWPGETAEAAEDLMEDHREDRTADILISRHGVAPAVDQTSTTVADTHRTQRHRIDQLFRQSPMGLLLPTKQQPLAHPTIREV